MTNPIFIIYIYISMSLYDEVNNILIYSLNYQSKLEWLRDSGHHSGRTFAPLEGGLNYHNGYLHSTERYPLWTPRVRRTPTRRSGDRWNSGSSLARLPTSPSLVVRSRSVKVQRPESVPLFEIPKSNFPEK